MEAIDKKTRDEKDDVEGIKPQKATHDVDEGRLLFDIEKIKIDESAQDHEYPDGSAPVGQRINDILEIMARMPQVGNRAEKHDVADHDPGGQPASQAFQNSDVLHSVDPRSEERPPTQACVTK